MKEEDSLTGTFLSSLVKEHHECKRKETNSVIRKNAKRKIQQAIKISGTKSSSLLPFKVIHLNPSKHELMQLIAWAG